MSMKATTFQAPEDTVRAFDDAAASMSLSREEALQNLMEIYLSHDKEFRTSVAIGLQQADAGQLLEESEIEARIQSWEREVESLERVA